VANLSEQVGGCTVVRVRSGLGIEVREIVFFARRRSPRSVT
jgi:hypothetical protein